MRCWSDRPPGASPGPRWSASCCGGSAPTAEAAGPPGRRPPCASRRVIRGTGPFESPSRQTALAVQRRRSEEHTSELQSRGHLVCRLLLEKKKKSNEIKVSITGERMSCIDGRVILMEGTLTPRRRYVVQGPAHHMMVEGQHISTSGGASGD